MVHTWTLSADTVSTSKINLKTAAANRFASTRQLKERAGIKLFTAARAIFFLLVFTLLFSGFMLMRTSASSEIVSPVMAEESVVYADSGDTLWHLADTVKKKSMDTRHAVYLLKNRNRLDDSPLRSGQMLIVPAEMLP